METVPGCTHDNKMQPSNPSFIHWFRDSAPYINAFRGRTFVIHFGSEAIDGKSHPHLVHDLALLNSLGIRLVLVYGARSRIERFFRERGIDSHYHEGLRITDPRSLECVKQAVGSLRLEIEALFSMGLANSPMAGADIRISSGNYVVAQPLGVRDGVDYRYTGEFRRVDTAAISAQLDSGNIVLLPPLGYSPTGEIFNLRAEQVACSVGQAVKAEKVIYLTEAAGLLDPQGKLIRELTVTEVEQQLAQRDDIPPAVGALLACAVSACRGRVHRTHLLDSRVDGALLQELFTRDGAGTLVAMERFEGIRPATIEDVGGILELIAPLERNGVLVHRSREWLEMEIEQFCVVERDGAIIACAALHPFAGESIAEVAGLAVHPDYRGEQRGGRLLEFIEQRARQRGIGRLFVLTTHTPHWFLERGYRPAEIGDLPVARQMMYNYQRNSKVFVKPL